MTNQEKFVEIMNAAFGAGFSKENMRAICSPCGALKKPSYGCGKFYCEGCAAWWQKEYIEPEGGKDHESAGGKRQMTIKESRALAVAINSLRFNPDLSDIEIQSHEIALANMRDREQEIEDTGLTPEEIKTLKSSEWIYRSFNAPSYEFEQTIGEVEKALGFRLFAWQKNYIAYGQFRQMGVTTAEILKDLLDVSGKPIDHSKCATSERERFYRRELSEIKAKLDSAGIPTRTVFFSERDKRAYKQKEGKT